MKKISAVLFCILLSACEQRVVELGSGYKYFEVDGGNYAIVDRDNAMVVDPNVTRYKIVGHHIVGEREKPLLGDDPRFSRNFGFFVINMQNGQYIEGLDKAEFEDALRARNLNAEPF